MFKNIFIYIIIAVVISSFFMWKKDTPIINYDSNGVSVVAFGDSLVTGNGSTVGNDFVSLVSEKIGEPIINLGVPGNTSSMGLERIDEVIAQNPKLVFVLFGGNDFLRGVPVETTFQNIDEIVVRLQDAGVMVVLLGVRGGILNDSYAKRFEDIARSRGTIYVPNVLDNVIGNQNLMSDSIHPNDRGYRIIADKIIQVLEKEL